MSRYQLAQLNIATLKAPLDDPIMAEFVANLDRINTLADQSPGFVWRLQSEQGNATELRPFGDEILVNLSVWQNVDALRQYVYRSAHTDIMRRRKQWFERMTEAYMVLWWVPVGHRPDPVEAKARLELLKQHGPTPEAFSFRHPFPAPDAESTPNPAGFTDQCPAL